MEHLNDVIRLGWIATLVCLVGLVLFSDSVGLRGTRAESSLRSCLLIRLVLFRKMMLKLLLNCLTIGSTLFIVRVATLPVIVRPMPMAMLRHLGMVIGPERTYVLLGAWLSACLCSCRMSMLAMVLALVRWVNAEDGRCIVLMSLVPSVRLVCTALECPLSAHSSASSTVMLLGCSVLIECLTKQLRRGRWDALLLAAWQLRSTLFEQGMPLTARLNFGRTA